jgi:hypothetical protein
MIAYCYRAHRRSFSEEVPARYGAILLRRPLRFNAASWNLEISGNGRGAIASPRTYSIATLMLHGKYAFIWRAQRLVLCPMHSRPMAHCET